MINSKIIQLTIRKVGLIKLIMCIADEVDLVVIVTEIVPKFLHFPSPETLDDVTGSELNSAWMLGHKQRR